MKSTTLSCGLSLQFCKALLAVLAAGGVLCAESGVFFVDGTRGSDDNPGTLRWPFRTIQAAVDAAEEHQGKDTVVILPGEYEEAVSISDQYPLVVRGRGAVVIHAPEPPEGGDADPAVAIKESKYVVLEGLVFALNPDRGVKAKKTGTLVIRNCRFEGNGGDGIKVKESDRLIVQNVVCQGNDDGLDLEEVKQIEVRNTRLYANEDEGLEVDNAEKVIVQRVIACNNGNEGLDIDDSTRIFVTDVYCCRNGGSGFQAESSGDNPQTVRKLVIMRGIFRDNGAHGIQIMEGEDEDTGEKGDIQKVTLYCIVAIGNAESGLDIEFEGQLTLQGIVSVGNGSEDVLP